MYEKEEVASLTKEEYETLLEFFTLGVNSFNELFLKSDYFSINDVFKCYLDSFKDEKLKIIRSIVKKLDIDIERIN